MVKGNMRITRRDFAWLAVGAVVGGVVTTSITTTSMGPPAASYAVTSQVVTVASPIVLVSTNFERNLRPVHVELSPRFPDPYPSLRPMYSPPQRSLDLIDTRSQPDITLEDLK